MSRFLARFYLGVAKGTFKIVGFGKFWYGLEIPAVFVLVSNVSFARCFFCLGVSDFFPQGLGVLDTFVEHLEISEFCQIKLIFI